MPPLNKIILPERLYGVLGLPLGQSLSPALHSRLFARLGHPGAYFRWEKRSDELPAFFQAVRALPVAGLSVTAPHKEAVIPFLDALSERARAVGAVNTIHWQGGRLLGDNTDVEGFMTPLLRRGQLPDRALVLGAGGAARAALAGLRALALPQITVCARKADKASALARLFDCAVLPWEERELWLPGARPFLAVNATPLGMKGEKERLSPLSEACLAAAGRGATAPATSLIYDLVYNPRPTYLLSLAECHGLECLDGLEFFAAQAAAQLFLWTGARPEVAELYELVRLLLEGQS